MRYTQAKSVVIWDNAQLQDSLIIPVCRGMRTPVAVVLVVLIGTVHWRRLGHEIQSGQGRSLLG
jgi:hypothetical protein